jgi:hypothetical protein
MQAASFRRLPARSPTDTDRFGGGIAVSHNAVAHPCYDEGPNVIKQAREPRTAGRSSPSYFPLMSPPAL